MNVSTRPSLFIIEEATEGKGEPIA
jgi:hypothetical protein